LHVTLEEGTWSAWLYDLLKPHVRELVVCDPRKNALLKEGNKSDKIDARKLADLLRGGYLRSVYPGENGLRTLKELARFRCGSLFNGRRVARRTACTDNIRLPRHPGVSGMAFGRKRVTRLKRTGTDRLPDSLDSSPDVDRLFGPQDFHRRITAKKRMVAKLKAIEVELRSNMLRRGPEGNIILNIFSHSVFMLGIAEGKDPEDNDER
jgi:hypothetical protein